MPNGNKVYKSYRAETKAIDGQEGYIKAIVSTEAIDRDGEVILMSAWGDTLNEFLKHPVLLSSHDYNDLTKQLGEWVDLKVTENGLEGIARYYINKGNPEADWGYELAKAGKSAYSVGFMSNDYVEGGTTQDGNEPKRTYTDVELLEISQVSVPSNRESLVAMRSKGIDKVAEEIAEEIFSDNKQYEYSPRQQAQQLSHEKIVQRFGQWGKSTGNDGSHYMEESAFKDQNMICGECVHWKGEGVCAIVEGSINEYGLCKLWIIPETELSAGESGPEETGYPDEEKKMEGKHIHAVMLTEEEKSKIMKVFDMLEETNKKEKNVEKTYSPEEVVSSGILDAFANLSNQKEKEEV
jgi:HK97 family phage prohead protease